ncbi:MAG TPA: 6-phosphogluconolactonase, partial [Chitinophagaceae bacterium]|nr:6-phosphogluconolactonase [Chitinophagaceae bacterium]
MHLKVMKDMDELSQQFAVWMIGYIEKRLKNQDRFSLVLSGGSTPKKLYRLLASDKLKNKIDWKKLHFFWGDERYVPFTDSHNNAKMAFDALLDHVPVSKEQIHIMRTDIEPEVSASHYEKLLHQYFPDANHTFDLILLGMGDNAHTLSLFPGYAVVNEKNNWVRSFYLKEQDMYRITLTAPVVNAAGCIAFLVCGSDKTAALYNVFTKEYNPGLYPSQVIQPYNDELYW